MSILAEQAPGVNPGEALRSAAELAERHNLLRQAGAVLAFARENGLLRNELQTADDALGISAATSIESDTINDEPDIMPAEIAKTEVVPARRRQSQAPERPRTPRDPLAERKPRRGNRAKGESNPQWQDDLVRQYLTEIGKYPLLTKEDETGLARAREAGLAAGLSLRQLLDSGVDADDPEARRLAELVRVGKAAEQRFVNSNLRLVVSIAKNYQASGLPLLDLIQEGNLGMMHAVEKFDWRKGFKFSTYATWWIRQSITRGIANTGKMIRLPVHVGEGARRVFSVDADPDNADLNDAERAALLDMDEQAFRHWRSISRLEPVSLDAPLDADARVETTLGDLVGDPESANGYEAVDGRVDVSELYELLRELMDGREAEVLMLRFGLLNNRPYSLEEIGKYFGLSRERARQLEDAAMTKLRHPVVYDKLAGVLPLDDSEWQSEANCKGLEPKMIFDIPTVIIGRPPADKDGKALQLKKLQADSVAICDDCPVAEQCLRTGRELKAKAGLWGGYLVNASGKFLKP